MAVKSWNPIAFVPLQVAIISSLVYAALFAALLVVHHVVPAPPKSPAPYPGLNITEAWRDLQELSDGYHPYNSRRSDEVRSWLLSRVDCVLRRNDIGYKQESEAHVWNGIWPRNTIKSQPVTVFNDLTSNVTFSKGNGTTYFEGTNIIVYIRGSEDEAGDWWSRSATGATAYSGKAGVLVNAHYDSVSTGFGATDNGVGVVTVLQLISYFTTKGNQPKRGVLAMLNNGEEDGLHGAKAYLRHPISQFAHTFLNLEGAGAGGRATLFRSTDAEVTSFYGNSKYPFGTVISADGFKRGYVRSGTDYSVLTEELGMRGLDVAFMEPRARYHTDEDDARDTSDASLWHMLSASVATMKALTDDSSSQFEGSAGKTGKLYSGRGSEMAYFDILGRAFAVIKLNTLLGLSVALLVAPPLLLLLVEVVLHRADRWYPFARKGYLHGSDDDEAVQFGGWRGFFRFPIAFVVATAGVIALAYLMAQINPYVIYSSDYAGWSMMLSAWFVVLWFCLTGADRLRPSALSRLYAMLWLYVLSWLALVLATVAENNFRLAGGYFMVIYNASIFVGLLISYLEMFGLPKKSVYVEHVAGVAGNDAQRPDSSSSRQLLDNNADGRPRRSRDDNAHGDEATEATSLLRGGDRQGKGTFARFGRRRHPETDGTLDEEPYAHDPFLTKAYGDEQAWSSNLPQWTWIIQFLIVVPINVIVVGQIALFVTSALHQTLADGNPALPIYLIFAALSLLLLAPLGPFIHRFTYHVPTFLLLVLIGTLVYNLTAFPFSRDARLKVYFVQQIDLETGVNTVSITGLDRYVQEIVEELPSADGQKLQCGYFPWASRAGLQSCAWHGLAPNVVPHAVEQSHDSHASGGMKTTPERPKKHQGKHNSTAPAPYQSWLTYNVTRLNNTASFSLRGRETKACRIYFDTPVTHLSVADMAYDARYNVGGEDGTTLLRLFSRTWDKTFEVDVAWDGDESGNLTGRVMCLWSDHNQHGVIPALDEVMRFQPVWSVAIKGSDGLVEGWKKFSV